MTTTLAFTVRPSPLGPVWLATRGAAVCAAGFVEQRAALERALARRFGVVAFSHGGEADVIASRLTAWFAGDLAALERLAVDAGGTPFQRRVWEALCRIAPGEVRTYAELARELGVPGATRAVGAACGRNPVMILVPCHRVVGEGGALRGYAGGLARKAWLLEHERRGLRPARREVRAAPDLSRPA